VSKQLIVAGGGVGGLSAAIHGRLAGWDVTLLEQNQLGGKAAQLELHGFKLDPGPSIIILPDIYRDVFRRAGKDPDEYLNFQRLDPISRVFREDISTWIDIPANFAECVHLARSISKKDAESLEMICDLMERVEPHINRSVFKKPIHSALQLLSPDLVAAGRHFAQAGSYKDFIDRHFESPFFRSFFYGFPSYSGQTYFTKSMSGLLIPYYMLRKGVFYPVGGVAAIPKAFERLARELGVRIRVPAKAQRIVSSGNRVTAVELEGGEICPCDSLISNIDRLTTEQLLGRSTTYHPSFSYFTAHWGIRGVLPNLSHHNLLVPNGFETGFECLYRNFKFPVPPITYLNVTSEMDPSTAPPGCTNLFAVVGSPSCEPDIDWKAQTKLSLALIKAQIRRFGWEVSEEDIIFERVQTPVYFQEEHGNFKGSLYGPREQERLFGGLFPLKCSDNRFKNLFYAGGSVQPGAGLPMVTLSGKFAADLASKG
jgi:phytoene desaturase